MSEYPLAPKANTTIAYTDGACKENPGVGGWGAYLIFADGTTQELYAGEQQTTNNRMELTATIEAIKNSPNQHLLEIWTDSSYVKNGITQWINNWKAKGWKTANKKPVKNQDLWQQLDELNQTRNIDWNWIKGHAGHAGNEKADELANKGVLNLEGNKQKNQQSDDWLNNDPLGFLDEDDANDDMNDMYEESFDNGSTNDYQKEQPAASSTVSDPSLNSNNDLDHTNVYENDADLPKFDGDTSKANPYFRPILPPAINKGENNRQLIMDTETTGFEYMNGDRIIEVGIVEMIGRKLTGEKLHVYINPNRKQPMSEEVIRVHGITDAFLEDKPTFDKIAQQVFDFMQGTEVIAHNANFDMNFLDMEFTKAGLPKLSDHTKVTDSLALAKHQYPGQKNTLDALVRRLNVGKQDRTFHGALLDAEILAEVYLAMTGGQVALAIDDDSNADGDTVHASFETLANLLITDTSDSSEHAKWLTKIGDKFPTVKEVWST
ncbi:MAG: DNA polymerase III subunit epsilon [Gammaproteobacteria bacterium]|nr:MAG: DNA polymerase III subunit epsilon [Gammaproteobacteria bacterium]